jgi:hypothetical protein
MGLTKEVRDFFTNRIMRLLNIKLEEVKEQINRDNVRAAALSKLCDEAGISRTVLARWDKIQEEQEALEKEENDVKNLIFSKIQAAFPNNHISTYRSDVMDEVESFAAREFEDKILEQLYPEQVAQIKKIEHIKEDVEGVVILSTCETKLVQRLTTVLQKYGGEISELLEYIPE